MNVCVASDFHLKFSGVKEDTERENRIISFLSAIRKKFDMLILNGDIFDLWYDWNSVIISDYFPVLRKLADLHDDGMRIVLISGNHDFWFNDFLPEKIGIEIQPDSFSFEADRKRIFCSHGDLYTSNDNRYKIFRKLIRNPLSETIFRILHPDISLMLGRALSRSSRSRQVAPELQKKKEAGMISSATKLLEHYDIVLMGHSHSPCVKEIFSNKFYANSGDWIKHNTYITIKNGNVSLKTYEINEQSRKNERYSSYYADDNFGNSEI